MRKPIAIVHVFYPLTTGEFMHAEFTMNTDTADVMRFAAKRRELGRRFYIEWTGEQLTTEIEVRDE